VCACVRACMRACVSMSMSLCVCVSFNAKLQYHNVPSITRGSRGAQWTGTAKECEWRKRERARRKMCFYDRVSVYIYRRTDSGTSGSGAQMH